MSRLAEREAALLALARRCLDFTAGDELVEAYGVHRTGTTVSVFQSEVERLSNAESRGVGVRVLVDGRLGFAATSDVSDEGLRYAVEEARSNAGFGSPDPGNVLPRPAAVDQLPALVDEALAEVPAERKVALALELERVATGLDPRVTRLQSANYGDATSSVAIASTVGMAAAFSRTDTYAYVSALARTDGETQTAFGFTDGRGVDDLDLPSAAGEAVARAVRLLGARKPPTASVPVVFDPTVTAEFLGSLAGMVSAEAVQKKRSLFAGRLGQAVAAAGISLVDDGRLDGGPGSAPFDDEGVPTGRTTLIDGGVLHGFLYDTETAARQGGEARSTGNAARGGYDSLPHVAPTNLYLDGPTVDPAEVLGRAGTGLYVQQVSGVHSGVNPVSGEFSVGATGLWIRDGALAEPVREVTVSATILEMLRGITALSSDRRFFPFGGSYAGCTLLVDRMTVAGS